MTVVLDPRRSWFRLMLFRLMLSIGFLWSIVGCGSDSSTTGDDTSATVGTERSVDELLSAVAATLAETSGLSFSVEQSGAKVYFGEGDLLAFISAVGRFAAPRSAEAALTVEFGDLTTEVGAVAIDGEVWLTNPISGRWESAPAELSFDPSTVFSADVGIPAILAGGLPGAAMDEDADDAEGVVVLAALDSQSVSVLTGGLVASPADVELVIDDSTSQLRRVEFSIDVDGDESYWIIALDDYGADVDIVDPTGG